MNKFFAWINSGTTAQQNKKRLTCYMIVIVAALLVISILTLAVIGIVSAVKKGNNPDEEQTVDPNRGYVSTTFAPDQLHKGDLLIVDELHPYIAEANADIETITIESGRAKIDGSSLYSSNALGVTVRKEALDAMNTMLLDFYNETQDDNIWVNVNSDSLYTAGNTFELRYTTGVQGAPRPAISESETYDWIFNNAYKYGFVQLFTAPEGNTTEGAEAAEDMTHIFRYVGKVHAQLMKNKTCETFSEYLEYLKTKTTFKNRLRVTIDKLTYEVCYIPQSETPMIFEKYKDSYTVSGNNTDGYIVTYSTATK